MDNSNSPKCSTIGCTDRATHILTWRDREEGSEYTEYACEPCGMMYTYRPSLGASLAPIGEQ